MHTFINERTYVREESAGDFILTFCDELSKTGTWSGGVDDYKGNLIPLFVKKFATSELDEFLPKAAQEPARRIAWFLTFDETNSDAIELIERLMPALAYFTQIAVAISFGDTHTATNLMAEIDRMTSE